MSPKASPHHSIQQGANLGDVATGIRSLSRQMAGLDDDNFTEIVSGDVKPGDLV